jgi:type II secretory ATPase GspE/PulE/Tfp pilus assembly ATPase PilB-like protein
MVELSTLAGVSTAALAAIPEPGGYIAPWKIIVMVVLAAPWLRVCPWVQKDAIDVRAPKTLWSVATVGSGALGLLLWLVLPSFVVGLLLFVVLAGASLIGYVVYRNQQVEPDYRLTLSSLLSMSSAGRPRKAKVENKLKMYGPHGEPITPPEDAEAENPIVRGYNLAQEFLFNIVWRRASDVEVVPEGPMASVRMRIDGVVSEDDPMDAQDAELLSQFLKQSAGMDTDERRRPQQGSISVETVGQPMEMMVKTAGTTEGQRLALRSVTEAVRTRLEELNMDEAILARVQEMCKQGSGLILVSGKARTGVTSTLYSLLRAQDPFIKQLVTLELNKEVDLENVTQNEYGGESQLAQRLASAIRHDPDVIMVDQCKDARSAEQIVSAADEKLFLVGMRAADSFTALARWIKTAESERAVEPLRGVLCQVLVRKLCAECKEAYVPDPQLLAKANLPSRSNQTFYRPPTSPLTDEKGRPYTCPACQGSGYVGRMAVFELLDVTDDIRQLVASKASLSEIKAACRKNKMRYLQEQALVEVIKGNTSVQEVIRVTQSQKKD